jgi:hypothetical protein
MKSLDMSFKQVWSTDGIVASSHWARISVSRFRGSVSSRMSEQILREIIAPPAPRNGATMRMSIYLNMVTNGDSQILQLLICRALDPYLAFESCENFLGQCGHEEWPFGSGMGTASISLVPAGGVHCAEIMAER